MSVDLDEAWNEGFAEGYAEGLADAQPDSASAPFVPQAKYTPEGWMALVSIGGSPAPYWRGSRITHMGARLAAWRMARKLNRLEAKGWVR